MIAGFATVLAASADDRRALFSTVGNRLGTVQQNIEKDFWVCWTLDALFNDLQAGGPRLLFKGGTSLCARPTSRYGRWSSSMIEQYRRLSTQ